MPHDRDKRPIKVGDTVNIPCVVTNISGGEEYCNLTAETVIPMFPGTSKTTITLNAGQVVLDKCLDEADDS